MSMDSQFGNLTEVWELETNLTNNTFELGKNTTSFYRHGLAVAAFYTIAYGFIFIVGLVGNCLVIYVVVKIWKSKAVTHLFILNLSLADLLVIIFCMPVCYLNAIIYPWILGPWMCKLVPYFQGVSVCASVYSLVAISFERFFAIWYMSSSGLSYQHGVIIVFLIWISALTISSPWVIMFDNKGLYCHEKWPDKTQEALFFLVGNFGLCYLIPLVAIIICYAFICARVFLRKIPTESLTPVQQTLQRRSRLSVLKMFFLVTAGFAVSWAPLYIIAFKMKVIDVDGSFQGSWVEDVFPIAQWISNSNSSINPIIYGFLNGKFRAAFRELFCGPRSRKRTEELEVQFSVVNSGQTLSRTSSRHLRSSSLFDRNRGRLGKLTVVISNGNKNHSHSNRIRRTLSCRETFV